MKKIFKQKIFIILALFLVILLSHNYVSKNMLSTNDDKFFNVIKNVIPEDGKEFIKKNIFHISWLKFQIKDKEATILDHEKDLKIRYEQIGNLQDLLLKKGIDFKKNSIDLKKSNNNKTYELTTLLSEDLIVAKHMGAKGTSYIDINGDNFHLVTATGRFFYTNLDDLDENNFSMKHVETNIKNFINSPRFLTFSKAGIKDLLVKENKIFVSYTRELKKDCFVTGLLVATLNDQKLVFDNAYDPKNCVNYINSYGEFNFHHSGGRIFYYDDANVILTSGEYRFRLLAQKIDSELGKILLINHKNRSSKVLSLGHRNPQGLFYEKNNDVIVSTEHGPMNGDELNIVKNAINNSTDTPKNYGWPIASYGEHYGLNPKNKEVLMKTKKYISKYELAPLKKSHKKFGFIEPMKYWVPGIAPSQIVKVSESFEDIKESHNSYYFGSMGKNIDEGDLSMHNIVFDINYNEIISEDIIPLGERIRDVVYHAESGRIVMFMETTGQIGLLKRIN